MIKWHFLCLGFTGAVSYYSGPQFECRAICVIESDSRRLYGCNQYKFRNLIEEEEFHRFFMYVLYDQSACISEMVKKVWNLFDKESAQAEFCRSVTGENLRDLVQLCGDLKLIYSNSVYALSNHSAFVDDHLDKIWAQGTLDVCHSALKDVPGESLSPEANIIKKIVKIIQEYREEYKRICFNSYFVFKADYAKRFEDLGISLLGSQVAIGSDNWIARMFLMPTNVNQILENLYAIHGLKSFLSCKHRCFVPAANDAGYLLKELVDVLPMEVNNILSHTLAQLIEDLGLAYPPRLLAVSNMLFSKGHLPRYLLRYLRSMGHGRAKRIINPRHSEAVMHILKSYIKYIKAIEV